MARVGRTLAGGETVIYQVVPDHVVAAAAVDAEHLEALPAVAFSSFMAESVRFDGAVGKAIGIGRRDGRYLTDADVRLVEDVGRALSR